jgi:arginyl-tRNA--protein-N-Asp/Glu arginylyltransferase
MAQIEKDSLATWEFDCAYIQGQKMRHHTFQGIVSTSEMDTLLENGWRHFAYSFFKHGCTSCTACRGLKINPQEFKPSRSQIRNLKKNSDLHIEFVHSTAVTQEKLNLINAFQLSRTDTVGWKLQHYKDDDYNASFYSTEPFSFEMQVRNSDQQLLAISVCDITDNIYNAIYTFYDPHFQERGLGVYCILMALEFAKNQNIQWVYLGQYNEQCQSLSYKAQFKPHLLMDSL